VDNFAFRKDGHTHLEFPKLLFWVICTIVAITSYILSLENNPCPKRLYNNFFTGLFHDLPEVLTKDIISPIKISVEGLEGIIKDYERRSNENSSFAIVTRFLEK